MFERFTDRSRRSLTEAQRITNDLGHPLIETDHMLAGIAAAGGVGGTVLADLGCDEARIVAAITRVRPSGPRPVDADAALASIGIDLGAVRVAADRAFGPGAIRTPAGPPFSADGKKALERSLGDALARGVAYIGTEHLVLGTLAENPPAVTAALAELDVTADAVRAGVERYLDRIDAAASDQWLAALIQAHDAIREAAILMPGGTPAEGADGTWAVAEPKERDRALAIQAETTYASMAGGWERIGRSDGPLDAAAVQAAFPDLEAQLDSLRSQLAAEGLLGFIDAVPRLQTLPAVAGITERRAAQRARWEPLPISRLSETVRNDTVRAQQRTAHAVTAAWHAVHALPDWDDTTAVEAAFAAAAITADDYDVALTTAETEAALLAADDSD